MNVLSHKQRPLKVVWVAQTVPNLMESYFNKEILLGDLGRPVKHLSIFTPEERVFEDDLLIVSLYEEQIDYLLQAREKGCRNIGFFHLGDEFGLKDLSCYRQADYVLRHYWYPHAFRPLRDSSCLGVLWVPIGYRTGVGPRNPNALIPMKHREIGLFFGGQISGHCQSAYNHRALMVNMAMAMKIPIKIFDTRGQSKGYHPVCYGGLLENARFALIPPGNSVETLRFYEALEMGCIPLMPDHPVLHEPAAMNNPPIPSFYSWHELAELLEPYMDFNHPDVIAQLDEKQRVLVAWWQNFKLRTQEKIRALIDASFERTYG